MREIRFRAWDTDRKQMIPWTEIKYDVTFEEVFDNEFLEVNQHTGLKDKNGVEIYEGDILSYFGFEYEVTFEESAFGWSEDGQFYAFAEMAIDEIEKTKIIGNVYENQELAK